MKKFLVFLSMTIENIIKDGILCRIRVDENNIITAIEETTFDGKSIDNLCFALPGLVNMHTHSAMTILRSVGSGLPLFRWLNEAIFPIEAQLTEDDIYKGALDACQEMRESGTIAFNDMYFSIKSTIRAAAETGMFANVALSVTDRDFDNPQLIKDYLKTIERIDIPGITTSIAPHAIYTVSGTHLQYLADFAKEHGTIFHIHISETEKEREDCLKEHSMSPIRYIEKLGILDKVGNRFIGAHSLWLDSDEIQILGNHGATVVHCPNSNLKLGSGFRFLYCELRDAGVNVTLGTDGCASSDNLDMIEAMKVMSLLQKGTRNDPSILPSDEVLEVATTNGYRALGLPDMSIKVGNRFMASIVPLNNRIFKGIDIVNSTPTQIQQSILNRLIYAGNGSLIANKLPRKTLK